MTLQTEGNWGMNLVHRLALQLKGNVRSLTGKQFWLRYSTLATYRALCAGSSALTGFTTSGAAHADRSTAEAVDYIVSVFNKYKSAAGLHRFYGRVAEIGPGDSCGVGLMFLADGCVQVDLVDRFFSARNEAQQQSINRLIVQRYPTLASHLRNGDFSEKSFSSLNRYYGERAAAEKFFERNTGYDFIVSCAVLEHVYNPLRAITACSAALNPGGMMLHQIDCRDHGQFSTSFHELKFLELPPSIYSPLQWGGGPNRIRLSAYLNVLQHLPIDCKVLITSLAGIPEPLESGLPFEQIAPALLQHSRDYVAQVRQRLAVPFRTMTDEDLMATSFMLVAKKRS
jgi:SAM-dependent methyltransferase